MAETIQTKQCPKCKQIKPTSEFNKNRSKKDGLDCYCGTCRKQYKRKWKKTPKGKVANRKEQKKHRQTHNHTIRGHLKEVFRHMRQRCNNPQNSAYKYYGSRGIKVKFISFDDFYNYVVNELKADPRGLTIDRIDNDGDYEPGNIRFVTQRVNNLNR